MKVQIIYLLVVLFSVTCTGQSFDELESQFKANPDSYYHKIDMIDSDSMYRIRLAELETLSTKIKERELDRALDSFWLYYDRNKSKSNAMSFIEALIYHNGIYNSKAEYPYFMNSNRLSKIIFCDSWFHKSEITNYIERILTNRIRCEQVLLYAPDYLNETILSSLKVRSLEGSFYAKLALSRLGDPEARKYLDSLFIANPSQFYPNRIYFMHPKDAIKIAAKYMIELPLERPIIGCTPEKGGESLGYYSIARRLLSNECLDLWSKRKVDLKEGDNVFKEMAKWMLENIDSLTFKTPIPTCK